MSITSDVKLGRDVAVPRPELVNLYGCEIGDETRVGAFVEVQKNAAVGARCKISSHSFICEGVVIEDEVFVGHGVMFTNDLYPRATGPGGALQTETDWRVLPTRVRKGASIGSHATVLPGIVIGACAMVGAGAVVTSDVPEHAVVVGNPSRVVGDTRGVPESAASSRLKG